MRVLLFDGDVLGHRETYVRRIAGVLSGLMDVAVAVPDELADRLRDLPAEIVALGPARPPGTFDPLAGELRRRVEADLAALDGAVAAVRADHALHLSGDAPLRWLVRRPLGPVPLSLLVFRPRGHYGASFGSRLTARERAIGGVSELMLRRWRQRRDAHAVLTLDPVAAERWAAQRGAPAVWLPEPPVEGAPDPAPAADRDGCALVGSLSPRKGIHLLAAPGVLPAGSRLVLAGTVAPPAFEAEFGEHVAAMEAQGVRVAVKGGRQSEGDLLGVLAGARCAVLPYPRHFGMSRVLLEAAAVRTPVVAHDFGLVGHLVRTDGLGAAVDCRDAKALGEAVRRFVEHPAEGERFYPALARFAERFAPAAFVAALRRVWP